MKVLFQKRRHDFLERCSKYMRYVLNDHFVLVLMVFLGFLSLQYRQLLVSFPENRMPVILILLAISFLVLCSGRIATYLEEADQIFLLTREKEVLEELVAASRRSFVLWSVLQVLVQLLFLPIYLKLGLATWVVVLYILVLLFAKYFLVKHQQASYQRQGVLDWSKAIQDEQKRQQTILRFFALFTTVKGISSTVKPRNYLNKLLTVVNSRQTWFNLYLRAFLRAGDYFGLSLRLLFLALLSLIAIEEAWLSLGLVLVFHYLLLFQLLGLYKHYDYQYMTQLYPLSVNDRKMDFRKLLRGILYGLLIVELVVALLFVQDKIWISLLPVIGLFLHEIYLPAKLKKID
ncbi:ABC transporter permease [Streptococcus suis]|nr:ABC transporter permease [Streptococcus suis]